MAMGLREMVVESVRVHMLSSQHVVILRETDQERYLPIWIGNWEAQSIAMKLQGVESERPLTHDLLATILEDLDVSVDRIVVSDLADETYRARIVLNAGEATHEVDARPSDAIALAVRVSVPIFATETVLDRAGVIPEADEEERLTVFRDFVNSLGGDAGTSLGDPPSEGPPPDRPAPGSPSPGDRPEEPDKTA